MEKQVLERIMLDQKAQFLSKSGLIERDIDLDKYLKTNQVVVITGARRCGKSTLLSIIKNRLTLAENEFCYLNFDDERIIPDVSLLTDLYALHLENFHTEPVFFFDEIQLVSGWEKFVNRMYELGRKLYVTGSNARLLSSEIATSLTGRTKIIELYPFSFSEFLRFKHAIIKVDKLNTKELALIQGELKTYLAIGGFPIILRENDIELINSWFQDILYRDIVARYRISSLSEIRQIALYLATNTGKIFSYSTLQSISGLKSLNSVKDYLYYLESSYLFFYLKKFDFSVKKQIMNSRKVYSIDNAVSSRLGFRFSEDFGRLMENTVFLELRRRGKELFYFADKYECDFLIIENLVVVEAIQVTYYLGEENFKRESMGLLDAMNQLNIPSGKIITFNQDFTNEEFPDNVRIMPLWSWLLNR